MNNRREGLSGESLACKYLEGKGYKVLERNFATKCGEIDVVAQKDGVIVFVEVKTREYERFGQPFEAVTADKQRKLVMTAESYLLKHRLYGKCDCRFDVVSILRGEITHIENAFEYN